MRFKATATFLLLLFSSWITVASNDVSLSPRCYTTEQSGQTSIGLHRFYWTGNTASPREIGTSRVGNIVVMEAGSRNGVLMPPHLFNLTGHSVEFTRGADGSYEIAAPPATSHNFTGLETEIASNESQSAPVGFRFPFFQKSYDRIWINGDGSITLGHSGRIASGGQGLEEDLFDRLPRIAPWFSPSFFFPQSKVKIAQMPGRMIVAWSKPGSATVFQVELFPSGTIRFNYDSVPVSSNGIAGIAKGIPGAIPNFISFRSGTLHGIRGTVAEVFRSNTVLDQVSIAKNFLATFPDSYDMLIVFPGSNVLRPGCVGCGIALIYKNDIHGIGRDIYDYTKFFARTSRLSQLNLQFDLQHYPENPRDVFRGFPKASSYSPLALVAHEVGHHWSSSVRILEDGVKTKNLLGDSFHWSFFTGTDGSFLGGNDIQDEGNGSFTTLAAHQRYSPLEQYLMGLRPAASVPPFFYAVNTSGANATDTPQAGIHFSGLRRNVTIEQVVAAEGQRIPASTASQRAFHFAFVLLTPQGKAPAPADLRKLEKIRSAFPDFFRQAVNGLAIADTSLPTTASIR